MRHLILAAALLALPAAANAAPQLQQPEREARAYLSPCRFHDSGMQRLCRRNQANFVEQYVRALGGDYAAQGSTFTSFSVVDRCPHCDKLGYVGMPADQVHACAWAMVLVIESPSSDPNSAFAHDNARAQCAPLTTGQKNAAWSAAIGYLARIHHHAVAIPADWNPSVSELLSAAR
ncbi:MAG: hypothetical protein KGL52_00575 [Rhodospirillales bacterium]|nr:hypothetical protein [Rhodospirillales bacterium]